MERSRTVAVAAIASLVLVGCGGDGDGPLKPPRATPLAQKQRNLTRAEYPAMRDWIISEGSSTADLRQTCARLDAAPDTVVIRATQNACDRVLSVFVDADDLVEDLQSQCGTGDTECAVRMLRRLRGILVQARRVIVIYAGDIEAVLANGPCRRLLASSEDLEDFDERLKEFDIAVAALTDGDNGPIQEWAAGNEDDELDDPTPCRPI